MKPTRLFPPEGHGTEVRRTLSGCIFTVLSDLDFDTRLQFERFLHCALYPWIIFWIWSFFCVLFLTSWNGVKFDHSLAHVIQPSDDELHIANLQILGMIHCLHRSLFEDI